MTPPRADKGDMRMSEIEFQAMLMRAAQAGAKRALADAGIDGKDAALDIRSLLDCIRFVRRTAAQTAVHLITIGVTLRQKLSQRPFGKYCISSDGDVPPEISEETLQRFEILTRKALEVTERRLRGESGYGTEDNEALKFLSWQFRRCPRDVATWLMDCIEAPGHNHPFVKHPASWVLVYQGLGRIVGSEEDEARAMRLLLTSSIED